MLLLRKYTGLRFQGDVVFHGHLEIRGPQGTDNDGSCMVVGGNFTVLAGNLSFHRCQNGAATYTMGGGLYVRGSMDLLDGLVRFTNCYACNVAWKEEKGEGGAFLVEGAYRQRGGTLEAVNCWTSRYAGAFRTRDNFELYGGLVSIRSSHSSQRGGSLMADYVKVFGGELSIRDTRTQLEGGAIKANFLIAGGKVSIQNASARNGGGIHAWKRAEVSGGVISIRNSSVSSNGGAIVAVLGLRQRGGEIRLEDVSAGGSGGGVSIDRGVYNISDGLFGCLRCTAAMHGGALYFRGSSSDLLGKNRSRRAVETRVRSSDTLRGQDLALPSRGPVIAGFRGRTKRSSATSANFLDELKSASALGVFQSGGRFLLQECAAGASGGAIYSRDFNCSGGEVQMERCAAGKHGGALHSDQLVLSGGAVSVGNSSAAEHGGALFTSHMEISSGQLRVQNTCSGYHGGGINAAGFVQRGGHVLLTGLSSGGSGGGLALRAGDLNASGGELRVNHCDCRLSGGAIYVANGSLRGGWARMEIENTKVLDRGGAIYAGHDAIFEDGLHLHSAEAAEGGCIFVKRDLNVSGPTVMRSCHASGIGGAISLRGSLHLDAATFTSCYAPASSAFMASGDASVGDLSLHGSTGMRAVSASRMKTGDVGCLDAPDCTLEAMEVVTGSVTCGRGMGPQWSDPPAVSCHPCAEDTTRLTLQITSCTPCPRINNATVQCEPTKLSLPRGFMVMLNYSTADNLSNWFRCPSVSACPGGQLNASTKLGEPVQVVTPMCANGYEGRGCTACASDYGRADNNVLQCLHCSTAMRQAVQYVSFHMGKSIVLLVSAVASVTGAAQRQAASAILLNQLMAFQAVAGIAVSGVMQTSAFEGLQQRSQEFLEYAEWPLYFLSGKDQTSTMSAACLLSMLKVEKELYYTHALLNLMPILLVVVLALIKGGWLAVVVGTNVFLADFTAAFGKYLVVFRVRPESEGGELCWDFLPAGPRSQRIAEVLTCITLCFALGVGSWTYVVLSRREPLQRHVAYLMQAYKTECSVFEVERLVRKMLLTLVVAVLPVSLSPALQMESVSIILTASLVLILRYHPYKVEFFNHSETALLLLALLMMGLTTCLVANDLHWAKSSLMQEIMIIAIFSLAAGVCLVMMLRFALAFVRERRRAPKKEEP